jgi:hypothetical protein
MASPSLDIRNQFGLNGFVRSDGERVAPRDG